MSVLQVSSELAGLKRISAIVAAAKGIKAVTATKEDVKAGIEALGVHLQHNRYHEAVAVTLALLLWDADGAVARFRRAGILRASRYKFRSKGLEKVLDSALDLLQQLTLRPDRLQYLRSVRALLVIAPEAHRLRNSLLVRLKAYKKNVLKTLLVVINELFVNNWQADHAADSDQFAHWSAEDLAQAFSYILNLVREEIGHTKKSWQHVDEYLGKPLENIYSGLLIDAAKLNEFLEVETLIDGMPYEVIANGMNLEVFSADESFEQSIRLGYIQADIQARIRAIGVAQHLHSSRGGVITMEDFIAGAFSAGMDKLVGVVPHPIERLVFIMPMHPEFFAPLMAESYFAEEIPDLIGAGIESFQAEDEDPRAVLVSQNLNVADIIKVQRLFSFISASFNEKLRSIQDQEQQRILRIRSVIPVIQHDVILQKLAMILPQEKAEEALRLLTLEEDQDFIDVQYRPLIKDGDYYIVAPALVCRSNLSRNIVVSNKLRNKLVSKTDPMQNAVVNAFVHAGFKVKPNFEFNINGKRETDIFCWLDGHLFVFECKNSFHPCSAHELRTSYERIKEGEEQLDIRLNWLKKVENQRKLMMALGWDAPVTEVHTGIITANRLFTSYRKGAHPVRQAHELINVLTRGFIGRGDEPPLRFWRGDSFEVTDIVDYLEGKSIVHMQVAQLQPFNKRIQLGRASLNFRQYFMDVQSVLRVAESAYAPDRGEVAN